MTCRIQTETKKLCNNHNWVSPNFCTCKYEPCKRILHGSVLLLYLCIEFNFCRISVLVLRPGYLVFTGITWFKPGTNHVNGLTWYEIFYTCSRVYHINRNPITCLYYLYLTETEYVQDHVLTHTWFVSTLMTWE